MVLFIQRITALVQINYATVIVMFSYKICCSVQKEYYDRHLFCNYFITQMM